ncbi:MAG: riboflavin synthase subunit alpha [Chlamydiia bacterium]|nr:riboflavin synthase subunit alpha [Chlamydiia bacterium]
MFSGIVQKVCPARKSGSKLAVDLGELSSDLLPGASVAVDGVCLTVVSVEGSVALFDLAAETLKLTTLGSFERVNIERALKIGDEVGGHFVSGHVMGVGEILSRIGERLTLAFPASLRPYLFLKGYVTVDGISLTIAALNEEELTVCLIPETCARTTLGLKSEGDKVNLEVDSLTQAAVDTILRIR